MARKQVPAANYVKRETLYIAVFVALVTGFLGGVFYSALKSGPAGQVPAGPPAQAAAPDQISTDQAERMLALEQEVAADPDNVEAWIHLGHLFFDSNRYQQAIDAYRKALALDPDNADVWTDLGVMYRRTGQPREAISAFDRAMTINPGHEQSRFNKGIVLRYDLNDKAGAIKAWEEVLSINPNATTPNGVPLGKAINQL
ncbi:MAG: tetratricopeptide repeat protein [Desulfobacterales bacterium]|nr:tetratricopeptide repeat protein [Desulfobacterales bacterium]